MGRTTVSKAAVSKASSVAFTASMSRETRDKILRGVVVGIIYARASQDTRGRKISVSSQITVGKRWFAANGIKLVVVLRDNNLSASRYAREERPDYLRALEMLRRGEVNLIWTWENSRAQREFMAFAKLRALLEERGGFWAYDDRIYDMKNADDRLAVTEDAIDAERETEKLRKRVRRGVESRAMEGHHAGPKSYGHRTVYDQDTGEALTREIDREQAKVVRKIVRDLLASRSETAVANELNAKGVQTARGDRYEARHIKRLEALKRDAEAWAEFSASLTAEQQFAAAHALGLLADGESHSAVAGACNRAKLAHVFPGKWDAAKVRNVALNPAIAGLRVFRGEIIGRGNWPAIITKTQRAKLVAKFGDPLQKNTKDGDRVKYLQTGITRCGHPGCGNVMSSGPGYKGKRNYRCIAGHVSRQMDRVDAYVVEALLSRLEAPDAAELFRVSADDTELVKALADAAELRAQLDGFTDQAADGSLTPAQLARITAKLLPKIEAAETRAKSAGMVPLVADVMGPGAREAWKRLELTQQRDLLRAVLSPRLLPTVGGRAKFNPEHVRLVWLIGPEANERPANTRPKRSTSTRDKSRPGQAATRKKVAA